MSVIGTERRHWAPDVEALSADALAALAEARLARQMRYVGERSTFYQRKLAEVGIDPRDVRTLEDLVRGPFTEKEELRLSQEEQPPLGAHAAAAMHDVVRVHASSGTTGKPSFVGLTARDRDGWAEMTARVLYAGGTRPSSVIAYAFSIGFFCGGLANADAIQAIGASLVPIGTGASDRLASAIQHLGIDQITCTPSYIQYFADLLRTRYELEPRTLGIRQIIVGGEPGGGVAAVREAIEADWDAKVFDAMGNADLAPVFLGECEAQAGMHFMGQGYLHCELIDPADGRPIAMRDGATGELVVTHLDRECVPLLRFRTRDHVVVWTSPCSCGRTSFRLRCVGRTDDMLIVLGVNVFPSAVKDVIASRRPDTTGELVIEIDEPGPRVSPPLRVTVEHAAHVPRADLDGLARSLGEDLRARLIVPAEVTLVAPGTLPRSEMKARLVRIGGDR